MLCDQSIERAMVVDLHQVIELLASVRKMFTD